MQERGGHESTTRREDSLQARPICACLHEHALVLLRPPEYDQRTGLSHHKGRMSHHTSHCIVVPSEAKPSSKATTHL
jgi:hypothetical protein